MMLGTITFIQKISGKSVQRLLLSLEGRTHKLYNGAPSKYAAYRDVLRTKYHQLGKG